MLRIVLELNAKARVKKSFSVRTRGGEFLFEKGQTILGEYDTDLDAFWVRRSGYVFDLNRHPIEILQTEMKNEKEFA